MERSDERKSAVHSLKFPERLKRVWRLTALGKELQNRVIERINKDSERKDRQKMALYSEKVMDHFRNPRNVGVIEDADGVGEVGNAKCGDIMKMYLKIDDDVVSDVKFETFGCGSAIASSSMATELIKGKPLKDAMKLTNKAVAEALDGLPAYKMHCSVLAEEAIQLALEDYYKKHPEKAPEKSAEIESAEKESSGD